MSINRIKSPFYIPTYSTYYAYSGTVTSGQTITTFVADGSDNTIAGLTYRVHSFDQAAGNYTIAFDIPGLVDILIAAGGGGGGKGESTASTFGGGGGAGGLVRLYGFGVLAQEYTVAVGSGGPGSIAGSSSKWGQVGGNSRFGNIIVYGGGHGTYASEDIVNNSGGSGGGNANTLSQAGNSVPGQGNDGGICIQASWPGAGGGGCVGVGGNTNTGSNTGPGGAGGAGVLLNFRGVSSEGFCGGGGGGGGTGGTGGTGGGGNGATGQVSGNNATSWGGGGGGAGNQNYAGGAGFRGIVIVRYPITG